MTVTERTLLHVAAAILVFSQIGSSQTTCFSVGYGGDQITMPYITPNCRPGDPCPRGTTNLGTYLRVAVPRSGPPTVINNGYWEERDGSTDPWIQCNGSTCPFEHPITFTFPTDKGWQEPELQEAFISKIVFNGRPSPYGQMRYRIQYTWNQPYCQSLAWDRLEHNLSTQLVVMVPEDISILEYGVRARDGDNGAQWFKCSPSGCSPGGPEALDINIKQVVDASSHMKGFKADIYNGNSQRVRNVELYINYKPKP